ncbi:MAG: hypothetical protein HKO66_14500 [Saprospiraceae bacterium]|nr:hypothetical protein [Bacteroidia bacterium]NNE14791.1 hypothetical protein [Saprospiraceae bacterium]NNL93448.1 hypothetical protein [Saprospiraceae bacterium]
MKKSILLPILLIFAVSLGAQKMDFWLDAGAKIQYGGTMLFNSAIGDDPNYDYTITTSTKIGGKIGINWNYTGVSFEVMTGKTKGLFQNTTAAGGPDTEVSVSSTDIYVLFRDARKKGYFELGPKVSFLGDVTTKDVGGSPSPAIDPDFYQKNPMAAVIGFGTYILGNDGAFSGILGLRFEYGFTDIVSDAGRTSETMRQPVNYTGDAGSTNPIFAGLVFELNWGIGGVGQARCGEKSKFIWF